MRMKARSPHTSAQVRSLRVNVCNLLIVIILKIRYKNKLTVTSAGKRPLGRPRRRWEDNIRMYLKEIGMNTRNWVEGLCECGIKSPGSISLGVSISLDIKNKK